VKTTQVYDINIKLTDKQRAIQLAIFVSAAIKFICLYGGSRSGKTFYAFLVAVKRAIKYPGSYGLVFRKTLSSLKIGMLNQTMPALWKEFAKLNGGIHPYDADICGTPFVTFNKSENILTFFNGSKIFFYGASATAGDEDSMTKILSSEYFTILVEEGNENEYKVIEKLFTRMTQVVYDSKGNKGTPKFITTLNPTTFESWDYLLFTEKKNPSSKEPLKNADQYVTAHFTPLDNTEHLSEDYISILNNLSPRDRMRFLEGEYGANFEGEIFKNLNWMEIMDWSVFERIVIYVDPSYKSGPKNDYKSVATVGICQGTFYVLDINAAQCTTYVMMELIHQAQSYAEDNLRTLSGRRAIVETWIENQGIADDFTKAHDEYCAQNGCAIPYKLDNTNKGDKFMRIESLLVPLNENYKLIFSNYIKTKQIASQVDVQFLNFAKNMPKTLHDDIPDSVHGAVMKLSNKAHVTNIEDIGIVRSRWR
jgi:phage terminase large subunit-like protein